MVYISGLSFTDVLKPRVRKRPLPLSKVAFSSLSMIREFWMSRPPIPPTPSNDLFLSFAIGREISGINSELPFSKFIFGNSQVFFKALINVFALVHANRWHVGKNNLIIYNDGRGYARTSAMRSDKLQQLLVCNRKLSYKYQGSFLQTKKLRLS